jgi:hypothetical protein
MAADGSVSFKGRKFWSDELDVIREVVGTYGRLSRQELANTVCELLDWRRPSGGLKTSEARELLELLEGAGQIVLPAASKRGRPRGSKTKVPLTAAVQAPGELRARLRDVEPVKLRLVETAEERRIWRELPRGLQRAGGGPSEVSGGDLLPFPAGCGVFAAVKPGVEDEGAGQVHRVERRGTSVEFAEGGEQQSVSDRAVGSRGASGEPCSGTDGATVSEGLGASVRDQAVAVGA